MSCVSHVFAFYIVTPYSNAFFDTQFASRPLVRRIFYYWLSVCTVSTRFWCHLGTTIHSYLIMQRAITLGCMHKIPLLDNDPTGKNTRLGHEINKRGIVLAHVYLSRTSSMGKSISSPRYKRLSSIYWMTELGSRYLETWGQLRQKQSSNNLLDAHATPNKEAVNRIMVGFWTESQQFQPTELLSTKCRYK